MTVAVVGAGIAGLAAAWELARAGADVAVLECERRTGGVIVTERRDGFVVEGGPDGFLAREPEIPALAAELGIAERLVDQATEGSWLWTGQALRPLVEGEAAALLGIETRGDALAGGFRSFQGGMGEVVDALAGRLRGAVRLGVGVSGIAPVRRGWRLALTGGEALEARGVVLAVPAYVAGRLLEPLGVHGARGIAEAVYQPSLTVSLAYRAEQLGGRLEGTGFVAGPPGAGVGPLRACTYASAKFPGRAPAGHVLLRAFLGPVEDDPQAVAHGELAPILRVSGAPLWARAFHWPRALPRYPAHHGARVAEVRRRIERLRPLAICGAGYDGAGVSACVRSGREAGRLVLERLGAHVRE